LNGRRKYLKENKNQSIAITSPASSARTKAQLSLEQERTVSVRPSRNRRVIEASYVRQKVPLS